MRLDDHVASLSHLLELERAEELRRFEAKQAGLPPEARQERGLALSGLVAGQSRSPTERVVAELAPARAGAEIPASLIRAGAIVRAWRAQGDGSTAAQ